MNNYHIPYSVGPYPISNPKSCLVRPHPLFWCKTLSNHPDDWVEDRCLGDRGYPADEGGFLAVSGYLAGGGYCITSERGKKVRIWGLKWVWFGTWYMIWDMGLRPSIRWQISGWWISRIWGISGWWPISSRWGISGGWCISFVWGISGGWCISRKMHCANMH